MRSPRCSAGWGAGAPQLAEEILAGIAGGLHAGGIRRFVISGGETSGAVVEALEVEALEVNSYVAAGQSHAMTPGAILFPST